ncbi:solute carrier family 22 member 13-like [Teleopsis dalmanni]|uniref:solute carrier family 22 member 13-like n=1 Tax=Teleopsis dalmanni TaxID=139649 RepID=UPI0018CD091F|nr:solute carrier family 22 member 13-like [Teleopsis dalmanni]
MPSNSINNGSKKLTSPAEADDIVSRINGNFGRWQLRTTLLIFLCKIPSAWFMACLIYTAPTPQKGQYYCKTSEQLQNSNSLQLDHQQNVTSDRWLAMTVPTATEEQRTDRIFRVDACNIYEEQLVQNFAARYANYTNPFTRPIEFTDKRSNAAEVDTFDNSSVETRKVNVIPCEHFQHNSDYISLVTQFDLVCSRQVLVSLTQSFHSFGALIGGLIAFNVLKHISPRRLMLIGMVFQIVCGNLTGLVTTFPLHIYFRCITSLFCALMYTSGQIILADISGGRSKIIVTTLFELFWSIGLILLPGISIFFDSWSQLYVAISSSLIVLVFLHKWIVDSPRWLLRHNKIDEALQILLESATFNNREIPLNLESQLLSYAKKLQSTPQSTGYWSIWDGKTKKKFLFAIHWTWVGTGILVNVMLILIRSLGVEHIHANTVSLGFAEMVGVFLGLFFILFTRRHWLWTGYVMLAAGLSTYLVWLVPGTIKESRRIGLELIFWIVLKLANATAQSVLITCTGELVAPEKRPMLSLSVVTFSRCCVTIAPFISTLTVFHQLIPITVFATLGVINGILMFMVNSSFWSVEQPRIEKVPTPNTYRRNSAIVMRRVSTCSSELSSSSSVYGNIYSPQYKQTISISDLWRLDIRCQPTDECDSLNQLELANLRSSS